MPRLVLKPKSMNRPARASWMQSRQYGEGVHVGIQFIASYADIHRGYPMHFVIGGVDSPEQTRRQFRVVRGRRSSGQMLEDMSSPVPRPGSLPLRANLLLSAPPIPAAPTAAPRDRVRWRGAGFPIAQSDPAQRTDAGREDGLAAAPSSGSCPARRSNRWISGQGQLLCEDMQLLVWMSKLARYGSTLRPWIRPIQTT